MPKGFIEFMDEALMDRLRKERNDALEQAAKIAELSCLSPPDGGSLHPMEVAIADAAASAIRAAKS